jgi:hypothetical protein
MGNLGKQMDTFYTDMRILLLTLFIIPNIVNAQIIVDYEVKESFIGTWETNEKEDYEGVYRFGMSEWESEFYLSINGEIICAQVQDHEWIDSEDDNLKGWQSRYQNYHNVLIIGNKFYSDETNGEFVTYKFGGMNIKGLKLESPPNSSDSKYEIGIFQTEDKLTFFSGTYPQTKFDIISIDELSSMTEQELKIIRNEIFARYGHVFIKGGDMAEYFNNQTWYYPVDRDVNQLLTEIEKQNIINIRKIEKEKNSP